MSCGVLRETAVLAFITVAALFVAIGPAVSADDAEKERVVAAKKLVKGLRALCEEHDAAEARPLLENAVTLHNALETSSWRRKLRKELCTVLRDRDQPDTVRNVTVETFLQLDDPEGAFEHIRELLPSPKLEMVDATQIKAIEATGKLAQDPAIPSFIEMMTKSKNTDVAKKAILALGSYGRSKRRLLVLEEMLSFLRLLKPSRAPGKRVSPETRKRWRALGPPLVNSLNSLTGREETSADVWLDLYSTHKRTLRDLFSRDGE